MKEMLSHPLDLELGSTRGELDLFAEEMSLYSAVNGDCCAYCYGTFSCAATPSTLSTISTVSCECCIS